MSRIFTIAIITILSICNVSCGSDKDLDDIEVNNSSSNQEERDDKWDKIPNYVSTSVELENFTWDITINTRLHELFPTATINYGIVYTYDDVWIIGDYFDADVEEGKHFERIVYRSSTKLRVLYPLFAQGGLDDWNDEFYYWTVYRSVQDKIDSGASMRDSEYELKDLCLSKLKDSANKIRGKYSGHIFVLIDGIEYNLKDIYY